MSDTTDSQAKIPHAIGDLFDVDAAVPPTVDKSHLVWNLAGAEWRVQAPAAANADTSGATLGDLETEVNQLKAALRTAGVILP